MVQLDYRYNVAPPFGVLGGEGSIASLFAGFVAKGFNSVLLARISLEEKSSNPHSS